VKAVVRQHEEKKKVKAKGVIQELLAPRIFKGRGRKAEVTSNANGYPRLFYSLNT
jgi:hypothetical protein